MSDDNGPTTRPEPPPELLEEVKAALDRARPHEIALLEFDSLVDADDPPESHQLRFQHPRLTIDLRVASVGSAASLAGVVHPRLYHRADIHRDGLEGDVSEAVIDGFFRFESVGRGLVRLCLIPVDDRVAIWSDWFRL